MQKYLIEVTQLYMVVSVHHAPCNVECSSSYVSLPLRPGFDLVGRWNTSLESGRSSTQP